MDLHDLNSLEMLSVMSHTGFIVIAGVIRSLPLWEPLLFAALCCLDDMQLSLN